MKRPNIWLERKRLRKMYETQQGVFGPVIDYSCLNEFEIIYLLKSCGYKVTGMGARAATDNWVFTTDPYDTSYQKGQTWQYTFRSKPAYTLVSPKGDINYCGLDALYQTASMLNPDLLDFFMHSPIVLRPWQYHRAQEYTSEYLFPEHANPFQAVVHPPASDAHFLIFIDSYRPRRVFTYKKNSSVYHLKIVSLLKRLRSKNRIVINGFVTASGRILFSDLLYYNENYVQENYQDRIERTKTFCQDNNLEYFDTLRCSFDKAHCSYLYRDLPFFTTSSQFFFFQHIRYVMVFLIDYEVSEEDYHMVVGLWYRGEIRPLTEFTISKDRVVFTQHIYKYSIIFLSCRFFSYSLSEMEIYRVYGCKFTVHESYASIRGNYGY